MFDVFMMQYFFLQSWLKKNQISRRAGDNFAEENYLSWRTLVTIADMKHQFLDLLADIGFVDVASRRRKSGDDSVIQLSGSEVSLPYFFLFEKN